MSQPRILPPYIFPSSLFSLLVMGLHPLHGWVQGLPAPKGRYIDGWVEHGMEWSRDGVHTNRAEGEFSLFKPWMTKYRGVCKRYLYLYCSHYQFTRNHRNLGTIGRLHHIIKNRLPTSPSGKHPTEANRYVLHMSESNLCYLFVSLFFASAMCTVLLRATMLLVFVSSKVHYPSQASC